MADSGIRPIHLCLPNRGYTHTFVLIKVLTALQSSLLVMDSNFKTKNNNADGDYWIEYFPFEFFLTEINKCWHLSGKIYSIVPLFFNILSTMRVVCQ